MRSWKDFSAFQEDRRTQDAVARNIAIIARTADHICRACPGFIARHSEIAWEEMRDICGIVREPFAVDLLAIWPTVKHDLPALKVQIDQLLGEQRRSADGYGPEALEILRAMEPPIKRSS